jgi:cardiolipin synthase
MWFPAWFEMPAGRMPDQSRGGGDDAKLPRRKTDAEASISPVCNAPRTLLSPGKQDYIRFMDGVTSRPVPTRPMPARPFALPNLLTYARIAAVPVVVACLYWQDILQGGLWLRWLALAIFIAAGVTDVLDGYYARKWGEQSAFGRMLDPSRQAPVASCLLMLVPTAPSQRSLWAAIVILCEILVGLREYLAACAGPVTQLANGRPRCNGRGRLPCRRRWRCVRPVVTPVGHCSGSRPCGAVHWLGLFPCRLRH